MRTPKKPTNLSVNSSLQARSLGTNLSATLEQALAEGVRQRRRGLWLAENRDAIAAYANFVEAHGVFSDGLRSF